MATVVLLLIIDLIIIGMVLSTSRDHDLTVRRTQTTEALYAAEAGVNMSIRELMVDNDDDGDGTIGTISDDGDAGTDPSLGRARFVVIYTTSGTKTTLTSAGRSGDARRKMEAVLEGP